MATTISDFASNFRGGVRPNLFRVDIQGAPEAFNDFHFFCKGAPIPASTLTAIPVPFRGRQLQVPGDRTFEEWTITVLNDPNWQHRSAFENWSNRINANSANISDFDDLSYYGTAYVLHLDRKGTVIRRYVLEDIFPTTIAAIDLTSDANDTVEEYTVSFAVNNVKIDGQGLDGTSSGSGFDIALGGSINIGGFSIGGFGNI
jgi:hypothetical protein